MPNLVFVALATGDQQSGYQAKVPDLPDLNVAGAGIADLVAAAREAILKALQRLTDEGQEWPRPTAAEAVTTASGETICFWFYTDGKISAWQQIEICNNSQSSFPITSTPTNTSSQMNCENSSMGLGIGIGGGGGGLTTNNIWIQVYDVT